MFDVGPKWALPTKMVLYPAALNILAMLGSEEFNPAILHLGAENSLIFLPLVSWGLPGLVQLVTCVRAQLRPVMMEVRDGEHTDAA